MISMGTSAVGTLLGRLVGGSVPVKKEEIEKEEAYDPGASHQHPLTTMIELSLCHDLPEGTKIGVEGYHVVHYVPGAMFGFLGDTIGKIEQAITRTVYGASHNDLMGLGKMIGLALKWYSAKDEHIKGIFQRTIYGLEVLHKTYEGEGFVQKSIKEWIAAIQKACDEAPDAVVPRDKFRVDIRNVWSLEEIRKIAVNLDFYKVKAANESSGKGADPKEKEAKNDAPSVVAAAAAPAAAPSNAAPALGSVAAGAAAAAPASPPSASPIAVAAASPASVGSPAAAAASAFLAAASPPAATAAAEKKAQAEEGVKKAHAPLPKLTAVEIKIVHDVLTPHIVKFKNIMIREIRRTTDLDPPVA